MPRIVLLVAFLFASFLYSCGNSTSSTVPSKQPADSGVSAAQPKSASSARHRNRGRRGKPHPSGRGTSGEFDFYVMSLSWSPGFCATPAGAHDDTQCGPSRHFAFVLHGLWPQYEQSGWPENCSTETVDEPTIDSMMKIMPSPKLVRHEWEKHGTCSGLSPKEYFEEAAESFQSVQIPQRYKQPMQQITVNPDQVQKDFVASNPKFGDQGFVVLCTNNGRFLTEVRGCLTKDLQGRPCNKEVLREACRSNSVIMRPVR